MNEVRRYYVDEYYSTPGDTAIGFVNPDTAVVLASDYDALAARLVESEKAAYDVAGVIDHLEQQLVEVKQRLSGYNESDTLP